MEEEGWRRTGEGEGEDKDQGDGQRTDQSR